MGIVEHERLLANYQDLARRHKLLKHEYMALVEECSKKLRYKETRIKNLKDDYNKLLELEQNKGWNEL